MILLSDAFTQPKISNYELLKTGFDSMDLALGGFMPSEFIIIGGRPSVGKSQFLVQLSLQMAKENKVLFHTLESNIDVLKARFLACEKGIDLKTVLTQNIKYNQENNNFLSIVLSDKRYFENSNELELFYKKSISDYEIKIICIDNLQFYNFRNISKNRENEITSICKILKNIAIENEVLIIATSQLSRNVEYRGGLKLPQLFDLRESGSLEEMADKVLFLQRDSLNGITEDVDGLENKGIMKVIIAKNKIGITDTFIFSHNENFTQFHSQNFTQNHAQNFDFDFEIPENRAIEF